LTDPDPAFVSFQHLPIEDLRFPILIKIVLLSAAFASLQF
jgi:hypothetical protein